MASQSEAVHTDGSDSRRGWMAANCVLQYLYELTREDDGEYEDELFAYGRLAICNKFLEREYWQTQKLMRYYTAFTHYARCRVKRPQLTFSRP
jgi:hypothetical protein